MSVQSDENLEPLPIYTNIVQKSGGKNSTEQQVNVIVKQKEVDSNQQHAYTFS